MEDAAEQAAAETDRQVVYVDPATDLPVRLEAVADPANGTTIELLPRTPENLDLLVPPIPAGYTRVGILAPAEARSAGCAG